MTDWESVVRAHHDWAHSNDKFDLRIGPPAPADAIASLTDQTGFPVTTEFRELYSQLNGYGVTSGEGATIWFLVPIERILPTLDCARDWFEETHPIQASRFFPFVDWHSGDYTGYLTLDGESSHSGLYNFDHENYEFDEKQPSSDFLSPGDSSIYEFLTGR